MATRTSIGDIVNILSDAKINHKCSDDDNISKDEWILMRALIAIDRLSMFHKPIPIRDLIKK